MNQQVAEAFKKLYYEKRTGVLTCEAGTARRAVYFQSGFVVSASSSDDEDRLGEVMIRHGRITRQHFEDAANFIKSGWKLGEILAELKIIEEPDIEAFVRLQLLEIACTQLIKPPNRLAFSPLSSVDACLEAPLSVADILMEAVRRTPDISEEIEALKSDERTLGFPTDPLKRFQRIHLEPEEGFVLSRIDGTQAPKDIFAVSPLPEEKTARTLMGLLAAEVIEMEGSAIVKPERDDHEDDADTGQTLHQEAPRDLERASVEQLFQEMKDQDHWQVLGIRRGASAEQVKQAFFRGAKRFHPDRFRRITNRSETRILFTLSNYVQAQPAAATKADGHRGTARRSRNQIGGRLRRERSAVSIQRSARGARRFAPRSHSQCAPSQFFAAVPLLTDLPSCGSGRSRSNSCKK